MKTIRDYLHHPAMIAMWDLIQDGQVIIGWQDGGEILVTFDSFLLNDETFDGSEQAVFEVVKIVHHSNHTQSFKEGAYNEVSTLARACPQLSHV